MFCSSYIVNWQDSKNNTRHKTTLLPSLEMATRFYDWTLTKEREGRNYLKIEVGKKDEESFQF